MRRLSPAIIRTMQFIVVTVIVVFAFGLFVLLMDQPRSHPTANRVKCASNLRQIGQAMLLYANENHGHYPQTIFVPGAEVTPTWGQGVSIVNPFGNDGPKNDVTAAMFLLLRTEDITSEVFVCPSSNAERDDFGGAKDGPASRSNFTDLRKNLSYSLNNPYPNKSALENKDKPAIWNFSMSADYALAADLNPGTTDGRNVLGLTIASPSSEMRKANSTNHEGDGQNVLYGDGHVEFQNNPFCGTQRDNIYTSADGKLAASPVNGDDSVLLPPQE